MEGQAGKPINRSFISRFGTSLFTAFLIYILEIIFVVAFTALIYSGELSSQIPRALGFIIIGDAILCAVVAWLSSYPGSIAVEQDTPGAMLGVIAVGIVAALAGVIPRQFATVTLMIVTTSVLTGLLLVLLGVFRLGGLARFLPYPVIGGFLAGTGWLLVQGGIGMMANTQFGPEWFEWATLKLWIPGLILGAGSFHRAATNRWLAVGFICIRGHMGICAQPGHSLTGGLEGAIRSNPRAYRCLHHQWHRAVVRFQRDGVDRQKRYRPEPGTRHRRDR